MIQSAVRVALREEAAAACAQAASFFARDLQIAIKTAIKEAIREELQPIVSCATASSAAATALLLQQLGDRVTQLGDRVASAVESAAERLHPSMGASSVEPR